jgi:tight adherence protein C
VLDSLRIVILAAIVGGVGAALLLTNIRWFRRISLTERLLPFAGNTAVTHKRPSQLSPITAAMPTISRVAERLAGLFGIEETLSIRLLRARWEIDAPTFRLKQASWAAAALGFALIMLAAVRPPFIVTPLFLLGAPLLAFLALEQQLSSAVQARQQALFNELPVVSEQLAMLLSAGYSVGGALMRLSERNSGVSGEDIQRVCERIRLGLSTSNALQEWSDHAAIAELHRLVEILTLSDESGDLGRLISDEAASIRREAQRRLIESIEKRGQQVWIPVTVATLVPGVIFLIIPFLQALQLFSTN